MSVVTISHSAFGGGRAVAERVGSLLDHRCVSREVLKEAGTRYGIPEAKFTEVLESEPHWWERWLESLRLYRITLQAAMCEVAQDGRLIYHGRAGQELFPGIRHVLKVFLVAPMEYRVEQVRVLKGFNEEAAKQFLKDLDRIRTRRLKAIFGIDWRDPSHYDLVLGLAKMSVETAAYLIAETVQRAEYQPTPESEQAFQDLTISARVQAALITSAKTRNIVINVRAESGRVHISGILADADLEEEILRIAKKVPGVTSITTDIEPPPIEYMHP